MLNSSRLALSLQTSASPLLAAGATHDCAAERDAAPAPRADAATRSAAVRADPRVALLKPCRPARSSRI